MTSIRKLHAHEYMHVEDTNTCEVLTLLGPLCCTLYEGYRQLHDAPQKCIIVPPAHYVIVTNPLHVPPAVTTDAATPSEPPSRPAPADPANSVSVWSASMSVEAITTTAAAAANALRTSAVPSGPTSPAAYTLLRSSTAAPGGVERVTYTRWKCPYGSREIRLHADSPFPLLPDEEVGEVSPLTLLSSTDALIIEALASHDAQSSVDGPLQSRAAQEEFLYRGPGYYMPRLDERVVRHVMGVCVRPTQACYLMAHYAFTEEDGTHRVAGEQWLSDVRGFYLPHPAVRVLLRDVCVVGEEEALLMVSSESFDDAQLHVRRVAHTQYLITHAETNKGVYMLRSAEEVLERRAAVHLSANEYCLVRNPSCSDGEPSQPRLVEQRVGPCSFLLQPGEHMTPVLTALVVREDEALLLTAVQTYTEVNKDGTDVVRHGGTRWLHHGPCRYTPPVHARVIERRRVMHLGETTGVYVRHHDTGALSAVSGQPVLLGADKELWARPLSSIVRRLLAEPRQSLRVEDMNPAEVAEAAVEEGRTAMRLGEAPPAPSPVASGGSRMSWKKLHKGREREPASTSCTSASRSGSEDAEVPDSTVNWIELAIRNADPPCQSDDITPYLLVRANVEHNTLMRLLDTSTGKSRVVAGPAMAILGPHEHFTAFSLSGGRPKRPHQIHSLSLYLGPDYITDIIEVETRDHARLQLHLAYNWEFDTGAAAQRAFTLPDFIGEACKALASRVRSAVAGETFDFFHRNSSSLIRQAIFAPSEDGATITTDEALYFTANGLRITTVDVQSVEPVDARTRVALRTSVQLAVEIITTAQESDASHQAALVEQRAGGARELQVMDDNAAAEAHRTALLAVVGENMGLEQAGSSRAQALAESAARLAEAEAELDATPLRCTAHAHGMDAELEVLQRRAEMDVQHRVSMDALAVNRVHRLAELEAVKYENIMASLGKETVVEMAKAGPELKARLLGALGMQGFVVTDGSAPINLMSFAQCITAAPPS